MAHMYPVSGGDPHPTPGAPDSTPELLAACSPETSSQMAHTSYLLPCLIYCGCRNCHFHFVISSTLKQDLSSPLLKIETFWHGTFLISYQPLRMWVVMSSCLWFPASVSCIPHIQCRVSECGWWACPCNLYQHWFFYRKVMNLDM